MQVGMLCAVHESQVGCGAASTRSTDATSWRQAAASKPMSVPSETNDAPAASLLRASSALRANTPAGLPAPRMRLMPYTDRKRVVYGKSVSIRVDLGGSRLIKKKPHRNTHQP